MCVERALGLSAVRHPPMVCNRAGEVVRSSPTRIAWLQGAGRPLSPPSWPACLPGLPGSTGRFFSCWKARTSATELSSPALSSFFKLNFKNLALFRVCVTEGRGPLCACELSHLAVTPPLFGFCLFFEGPFGFDVSFYFLFRFFF